MPRLEAGKTRGPTPKTSPSQSSSTAISPGWRSFSLHVYSAREFQGYICEKLLLIGLGCASFDLFGGGKAEEKYGGVPDQGIVRWMYSSVPGLIACRGVAKRTFRRWQKLKGGLSRTSTANRTP